MVQGSLPSIGLRPRCLARLDAALGFEWLLTNGLGGYASSTSLDVNTRKYHGVLVASLNPPGDRTLFIAKIDEELVLDGVHYKLGSNEFESGLKPEGYKHLSRFDLKPFPCYLYNVSGVELKKTISMVYEYNASVVEYYVVNPYSVEVKVNVSPLISCRHIYSTLRRGQVKWLCREINQETVLFKPLNRKECVAMSFDLGVYHKLDKWLERVFFRVDHRRGESFLDDYYIPGFVQVEVNPESTSRFRVLFAVEEDEEKTLKTIESLRSRGLKTIIRNELSRLKTASRRLKERNKQVKFRGPLSWLLLSADSFIVDVLDGRSKTVIAGYPWFGEWGRDTFISLPGLTLVTYRLKEAKQILTRYGDLIRGGLIPSTFPDVEPTKPEYSSIDPPLWYINVVYQYLKYSGDFDYVKYKLLPKVESIVNALAAGEAPGVKCRGGLLHHNAGMTWMDARINGVPVTPREGCAVEIQALWYNALKITETLCKVFEMEGKSEVYGSLAEEAKETFLRVFWNPELNCLYDVVDGGRKDPSVRPNQIFAVSLDFSMLDKARMKAVVDRVWRDLWAIYGLRSLSRSDPNYMGRYSGDWIHRDRAYHNGTVWAWLTGPFVTAFLKVKDYKSRWRRFAYKNFLDPLFSEQVYMYGLGSIGEIFDGDWPHSPDGCISQAWSVAEPLRAYVEDVLYIRPRYEFSLPVGGDKNFLRKRL